MAEIALECEDVIYREEGISDVIHCRYAEDNIVDSADASQSEHVKYGIARRQ